MYKVEIIHEDGSLIKRLYLFGKVFYKGFFIELYEEGQTSHKDLLAWRFTNKERK
ncbi:hypothetical protein HN803_06970 [candidate division WWE3 bacterium]|nr:hypothetical protein [candidate division WWE3 bacterium]